MRYPQMLAPALTAILFVPTILVAQEAADNRPESAKLEGSSGESEDFLTPEQVENLKLRPFGPRVPNRTADGSRLRSTEAPALSGIAIDGDLSDWPSTIARHPIDNLQILPPYYGPNGLEGADLTTSPDLSASFSVGYDPIRNLIYVAVVVRDDRHIIGHQGFWDTDAVEIFVDGRHSEATAPRFDEEDAETINAGDLAVLQYIGIAGEGPIYGVKRSAGELRGPDNPILMFGNIKKTCTRMEYRRERGLTVYEWAIEAFDHYPDRPTKLTPGKKIGFDVGVADKDAPATTSAPQDEPVSERVAWVSWWPGYYGPRYFNAADMGEIILGPLPDDVDDAREP